MYIVDKKEFVQAVEEYFSGDVTIETNEGEYRIEDGDNYVGGLPGTYMCELLGNVSYSSLGAISNEVYNYVTQEMEEVIVDVY